VLHDLEEPVGAAHGKTIAAATRFGVTQLCVGVEADAVAFGVEDLGVGPHAWPKLGTGRAIEPPAGTMRASTASIDGSALR